MDKIIKGSFSIEIIDKNNSNDLLEVQKLRYKFLVEDYNCEVDDDGIDDDGFDSSSDILIVRDLNKNKIVGTYRFTTPKTNPNNLPYMIEKQYNIDALKQSGEMFVALSRACVHVDYRDGSVIKLLFEGIFAYCDSVKAKYFLGLCSFHGHDIEIYKNAFSYLYSEYQFKDYDLKAISNAFSLNILDGKYDKKMALKEMPPLLRMYLQMGCKVCPVGSIDYEFNSVDVMTISKREEVNQRMLEFLLR